MHYKRKHCGAYDVFRVDLDLEVLVLDAPDLLTVVLQTKSDTTSLRVYHIVKPSPSVLAEDGRLIVRQTAS